MKRQYVAIDLHRRRSLIVRENEHGEELEVLRIENDPVALRAALAEAGPDPEVAIEACRMHLFDRARPLPQGPSPTGLRGERS